VGAGFSRAGAGDTVTPVDSDPPAPPRLPSKGMRIAAFVLLALGVGAGALRIFGPDDSPPSRDFTLGVTGFVGAMATVAAGVFFFLATFFESLNPRRVEDDEESAMRSALPVASSPEEIAQAQREMLAQGQRPKPGAPQMARVLSAQPTGKMVGSNDQILVVLRLEGPSVDPTPLQSTVTLPRESVPELHPGATIWVHVDPARPHEVKAVALGFLGWTKVD